MVKGKNERAKGKKTFTFSSILLLILNSFTMTTYTLKKGCKKKNGRTYAKVKYDIDTGH